MTIKRSLDDSLPTGSSTTASGWTPDSAPRWAQLLAEKWQRENEAEGPRPHAIPGTRFRHSDAGGCARKLAYKAAGIAETDPMDVTGVWNTHLGTMIHDAWQEALREAHPDAEIEVTSQAFDDGSGSMDALITIGFGMERPPLTGPVETRVVSYELKSVGGYAFKAAVGKVRRGTPPEGPKHEHVIQGSLNALAHGADELVIGYLAKETLSKSYDEVPEISRFTAEWTLTRAEYEPIARLEIERVEGILSLLDGGELAARKVPGTPGEIVDPAGSRWVKTNAVGQPTDLGTVWNGSFCSYCSHYSLCVQTPSGRIPVETAVKLREVM